MHNDSNSNSSDVVELRDVRKEFHDPDTVALSGATLSVRRGEFVVLVGPSGEGKSTILKLIAGLETPTAGVVRKPAKVAMAFQSAALFPWLSVFENVALGLRAKKCPEKETRETVAMYLKMMGLSGLEEKRPPELSGGQAQRVGIARALAVEPEILLLDEPFSALDAKTTAELHDDVIRIWQQTKKTIIMVSHIIEEAVSLADRVLLIKKGRVAAEFPIALPYPRREQAEGFMRDVQKIRNTFFEN